MMITNLFKTEKNKVNMDDAESVYRQLPIGKEHGSPVFSFRVFTVEPGGHTPFHVHDWEHLNYIIKGSGTLVDEEGNESPITEGDFALVLPGEKHSYKNTSADTDLLLLCGVPKEYE